MSEVDELAELPGGIKPKKYLKDGEEVEAKSQSSNTVYKIKRTWDHYYCTCPAWRNQSKIPVNARSCKHIRELLGDTYENARIKLKNPDGPEPKAAAAKKTKAKAPAKRKKDDEEEEEEKPKAKKAKAALKKTKKAAKDEEDDDEDEEEEEEKPKAKKAKAAPKKTKKAAKDEDEDEEEEEEKPKAKKATPKKGKKAAKEEEMEEDEDEEMEDASTKKNVTAPEGDELAELPGGIKPKKYLKDGEEVEAKSLTSDTVYKIKRTWDHYYCTCPAWRNQSRVPVNARSCKHIRSLLGDAYENARIKLKNPDGAVPAAAEPKKTKAKPKKKNADDEGEEEEEDEEMEDASAKTQVPKLLLANKWDLEKGIDPTGWHASEKLDGVRVYWDGKQMLSRLGNPFTPPKSLTDKLPMDVTLDGELFGGRGKFQDTVSIVKTLNSPHWESITLQVFDVPSKADLPFEKRLEYMHATFGSASNTKIDKVEVVEHAIVKNREHVFEMLKEVERKGGEGLMLRKAESLYEGHRSSTLLKVKTFYDAEAKVTGYEPGKGKNKGVTGALKCVMESGKKFNVGTGLSDKVRANPPKVGSIVVYRFQDLTRDGVPRFPSFIGESADKTEPKDAEVPEHKKGVTTAEDE